MITCEEVDEVYARGKVSGFHRHLLMVRWWLRVEARHWRLLCERTWSEMRGCGGAIVEGVEKLWEQYGCIGDMIRKELLVGMEVVEDRGS